MTASVSCVILTMGDRPAELERAIASVVAQQGDPAEIVVVGNGVDVERAAPPARFLRLPDNVGIPAGRNAGAAATSRRAGAVPRRRRLAARRRLRWSACGRRSPSDPRLGIVSLRIADPDTGTDRSAGTCPSCAPADPARSAEVTTFLGGASVVRRAVLDRVGGLPDAFFYAHEETDLAWRALDDGWRIRYLAEVLMYHPATAPGRHAAYLRLNARNRVWLARRRLPWPLVPVYLGRVDRADRGPDPPAWARSGSGRPGSWRGGAPTRGERRPMRWRTVARMTRLGRPPVV